MRHTKTDMIQEIAKNSELTIGQVKSVIEAFLSNTKTHLLNEDEVALRQFATFTVKDMKGRKGNNPQTKIAMIIPPYKKVVFKLSKSIKNKLNNK